MASSDGRSNIKLSLLIGFVKIVASEQLGAKPELSSLSKKILSGRVVLGKMAQSRKIVEALETKVGTRK